MVELTLLEFIGWLVAIYIFGVLVGLFITALNKSGARADMEMEINYWRNQAMRLNSLVPENERVKDEN